MQNHYLNFTIVMCVVKNNLVLIFFECKIEKDENFKSMNFFIKV